MKNILKIKHTFLRALRSKSPRLRLYSTFYLLGIAMIWPNGAWLVFVALIPLISYLPHMKKYSLKTVLKDFYLAGFLLCGFANLFLFQVAPENWTVQFGGWFGLVSRFLAWIIICTFCSLSYMGLGYVLFKLKNSSWQIWSLIGLLPLTEFIRSYLFALTAYGPGGNISPNFNWGSIAVPASGTPLVFVSRIVGFFGITTLVVAINICFYYILIKKIYVKPILSIAIIAIFTLFCWSLGNNQGTQPIKVSVLHLNENSDMTMIDQTSWPPQDTDILVLPEYSAILDYKDYKTMLRRLSPDGVAISSRVNGRSPEGTNRLIILNRDGEIVNEQDKTFLIPTGEYIPYSLQTGFRLINKSQALTDFTYTQQLTKGDKPESIYTAASTLTIGSLTCSGVGALYTYTRLTNDGADILTNSASLSFLQPNSLYNAYAHNMARYQAVSNNRPFLQSSRSGESYIIDNQGTYLESYDQQENTLLSNIVYK